MKISRNLSLTVSAFLVLLLALQAPAQELVVYSGRGESLVGSILADFEKDTGIELDVRYDKTPALATRLATEAGESPADVIFLQESGYLGALAEAI